MKSPAVLLPFIVLVSGCQTLWMPENPMPEPLYSELGNCSRHADTQQLKAGQFGYDIRAVTYRTRLPDGGYCRGETGPGGKFWYHPLTKTAFYLGGYQVGETWGQKHITPALFEMQPLVHYSNLPTKGTEDRLSYRTRRLYSALSDSMKAGHLDGEFEIDKAREWAVAEHYFGKGQSAYYDPGYHSIFALIGINDLAPRTGTYKGKMRQGVWHPATIECFPYEIRFDLVHDKNDDVGRLSIENIQINGVNGAWEPADGYYPEPDQGAIFPVYSFTELRSSALENPISMTVGFNEDGRFYGKYHDEKSQCQGTFVLTKALSAE